jgi:DNA-binding transcriptional LysR family regulator
LLQRSPTGARLTPAGERVVALSRRVLSDTRELMAGVAALVAEESSHLRVAASLTVAEYLLPAWLAALHRKDPDAILAVEVTNSAQVVARVAEHHADVGFVEGHQPRLGAMKTVVVRTDHLVMVVDPSHPWAHRQSPVTGPELAEAELIVREPGSGTRQVLEDTLDAFGGLRSHLELGSTAAILAAVRRGEGPAALSALAVADDLDAGRLVAVPTEGITLTRSLRAVWPTDRPLPPLARDLLGIASS